MTLADDQTMLRDTARAFLAEEGNVAHLRRYRDMDCQDGFAHGLWKRFGELGLSAIAVPEADGGLGLGAVDAGLVLEEIGRNLTPSPFLTTAIVGVEALKAGDAALRARWLPGIAAGETVIGIAIDEGARHAADRIATTATRAGNGFRLDGRKACVIHGASADLLIVAARTDGGVTLFAVPRDAAGLTCARVRLVDSAMAAHVSLDGVMLDADAVIGAVDGGAPVIDRMLAAGRIGAAAELCGVGEGARTITLDYLKTRQQFGKPIGSFQALQHRAAHCYAEMEAARAVTRKAQVLLDADDPRAPLMIAAAKAKAGMAARLSVQEGVQMHGGVGMTDEYDIGLYMKRDRALDAFMGDVAHHADTVARLSGY